MRYDGKSCFPVFFTYPDTTFGDDLGTAADYRDPHLQKLIAEKDGYMLWPPIRFSYDTHNKRPASPFPAKPTWLLTDEDCKNAEERGFEKCADLESNWLGTDDQGRDVVARVIYGFRISVLFGLTLTVISSIIGVAAGAVQGYFGGWTDLLFQRFIEIWTSVPVALSPAHHLVGPGAGVLRAARHPAAVLLGGARRPGARGIPARAQLRIHPGRARSRRFQLRRSCSATCCRTRWWRRSRSCRSCCPASVMTLTSLDFLGFGLPAGSPSLGELLAQGKANIQAPWLGLAGFFSVAIMLSLLIFIGEAVRDAFDPRKTFA